MNDFHPFGWYAAKISPHLPKKAFQPVRSRLFGGLAYLLVVTGGILAVSLFHFHPVWNLLISVVLGFSFAALGFLGHEILHGTVVKTPWLRDLLGAIAFWPLCTGPKLWRKWHNATHHVHTQHEEKDPDAWPSMEQLAKSRLLRWVYRIPFPVRTSFAFASLSVMFTVHSIRMLVSFWQDFRWKNRIVVLCQFLLPWTTWIGLLWLVGWEKWLFAFLLPLLVANMIVMGYISTNHRLNPLVPVNDPLANSLSVTVPKWVDVLHFHFSYHTEHHLFPAMSSKYYPLVKEQIKRMWPERYHEMPMTKALAALWKTPRIYYEHNELIEPKQGHVYGTLGNGLDPDEIAPRRQEEDAEALPTTRKAKWKKASGVGKA
ncbi:MULTISPECIES: acyl-CoA desaturase [Geobacillus]|uniref:fatty acid desaturase family protein n=1 Tax=Geobacillus TaxID=129337 RepID=UPI00119D751A|nr:MULTISPECIES: acyl-CoA desaturase [Geobacillus]NNV06819.1 acyl-CoA desaturase [Geobacillus sp. MMMUD3]TWG30833.1 fatty acid desaturase [Geobacillus sp. C56-T2]WPZ17048.1 acyl-CoA desaturase [Geobacillus subterraneus]